MIDLPQWLWIIVALGIIAWMGAIAEKLTSIAQSLRDLHTLIDMEIADRRPPRRDPFP